MSHLKLSVCVYSFVPPPFVITQNLKVSLLPQKLKKCVESVKLIEICANFSVLAIGIA
jgi:hypothetical protein